MPRRFTPRLLASFITLSVLFTQGISAQTSLDGKRAAASTATTARFTLGLSKDGGTTFTSTAVTSDNIRLIGTVRPEAAQVGQTADIFVVANYNGQFFMRNSSGAFVPWNGQVASIVPYLTGRTLTANYEVDFLTGKIPYAGNFALFLGYKAADNVLTYTAAPAQITMTAPVVETTPPAPPPPPPPPPTPTVSALEQAQTFYNDKIEGPVIQNLCSSCHVSGQIAEPSGILYTNDRSRNFLILRSALSSYGRSGLLNRSMGIGHTGGQVFISTSQQSYKDFDTFLQMAEKL